jgi:hypothetical protein
MPPAISGQHGHDATFAVAKKLVHDFGMTEAQALPILLDFNARCQPPWNEDELRHKLEGARNLTRPKKPRGHLREEIAKSMPPAGQAVPWTKTPAPLPKRVQQEAELAVGLRQVQNQPEVIDRFIEEVIVREKDALCAFHYLFHCYKIWRASCSLFGYPAHRILLRFRSPGFRRLYQLRAKTLPWHLCLRNQETGRPEHRARFASFMLTPIARRLVNIFREEPPPRC